MPDSPAKPTPPRDAIIFVPGLGAPTPDQSSEGVAQRVAKALQRACRDTSVRFELDAQGREEEFLPGCSVGVRTILRRQGERNNPVIDVYSRNYSSKLTETYDKSTLFYKAGALAIALVRYTPSVIFSIFRTNGKTAREKFQLLYATGVLSVLWVYMVILTIAVVSAAWTGVRDALGFVADTPTTATTKPDGEKKPETAPAKATEITDMGEPVGALREGDFTRLRHWLWDYGSRLSQLIALLGTLLLAACPGLQQAISKAAVLYLCGIQYLSDGDRHAALAGDLTEVLTHVLQQGKEYRHVHLVAYSFGSIITLDALFPFAGKASEPYRRIDTLVTVGSNFDIVRTYWTKYFTGRHLPEKMATRWLNVYSPSDILGSNFRNQGDDGDPEHGIESSVPGAKQVMPENLVFAVGPAPRSPTLMGLLTFAGFRAHTMYWDTEDAGAISFYGLVVEKLYGLDPILADSPVADPPLGGA